MPLLIIIVAIVLALWALMLLFQGVAWFVSAGAALIAVPSVIVMQPIRLLLESGGIAVGVEYVYIALHAAIGAFLGLWIGRRAAGVARSDVAEWPGRNSQRSGNRPMPGGRNVGIALPKLPWDVRLLNTMRSLVRRLVGFYELHPGWAWAIGVPVGLFLVLPLVMFAWPLLLIGAVVLLVALIKRRRRMRSSR